MNAGKHRKNAEKDRKIPEMNEINSKLLQNNIKKTEGTVQCTNLDRREGVKNDQKLCLIFLPKIFAVFVWRVSEILEQSS